ncbi:hypothetical protein [uncultured Maricaulis sp.]|uniref:hypothetical protein n=1 Tax=uncultured Maricaulis sp. TaxID=174710 RepID=UPI0030DA7817|tara:strand:- start:202513 stop:203046 length:534 start_codon:yes stop_codon:yes gene_type:complete
MTLESIYYIGQTVSVIAILGSLVFVGIQVRHARLQTEQANTLARAEMSQSAGLKMLELLDSWYQTKESAEFMHRALRTDAPLSRAEKQRFGGRLVTLFSGIEVVAMLYREDLCDQSMYDRIMLTSQVYCNRPRVQKWWHSGGRAYYLMPFQGTLDAMMTRADAVDEAVAEGEAAAEA